VTVARLTANTTYFGRESHLRFEAVMNRDQQVYEAFWLACLTVYVLNK
jgi:hypothetical protein